MDIHTRISYLFVSSKNDSTICVDGVKMHTYQNASVLVRCKCEVRWTLASVRFVRIIAYTPNRHRNPMICVEI